MTNYATASVRKAYQLPIAALVRQISMAGVLDVSSYWGRDQLAHVWLEHYGRTTNPDCPRHGDTRDTSVKSPSIAPCVCSAARSR
jgi:hypothetical protein